MPSTGECALSPIGSARSSGVLVSSAMSGTNWRAIGSAGSACSIRAATAGVIATAYRSATRARSASLSGGARPAATSSEGMRMVMRGCLLRVDDRRPQHLLDALRARCKHHQPVEAERDAGCRRHLREPREEILIQRIALAVHALFFRHFALEAAPLLGGIGELAERVRDLDAADIELEALGNARIVRRRARERRLGHRTFVEHGRAPDAT